MQSESEDHDPRGVRLADAIGQAMAADAGSTAAARSAYADLVPEADAYLIDLGRLIAHGTARELHDLVDDVSFDGWASIASVAGMILDEDGEPYDADGRLVALPPLARHAIANLVDDAVSIEPGWLARYQLREWEQVIAPDDDDSRQIDEEVDDVALATLRESVYPEGEGNGYQTADQSSWRLSGFLTLDVMASRPPPPREFLCGTILERKLVTVLAGAPGIGKTTIEMHVVVALAAGLSWAGLTVPGPARVVYVNNEDTPDEIQRRLMAVAKKMGVHSRAILSRILVHTSGEAMYLMKKTGGVVGLTEDGQRLTDAIRLHRADAVVIDPLNKTHYLEENNSGDMTAYMEGLNRIARGCNCAVLLAHHAKKEPTSREPDIEWVRGSGALVGSARSVWALVSGEADQSPRQVKLCCLKANNTPLGNPLLFRQGSVRLSSGDEVGVLLPTEAAPTEPSTARRSGR